MSGVRSNYDRAYEGHLLLQKLMELTGVDPEDALVDALAQLMHCAAGFGYDFDKDLASARLHYEIERKEAKEGEMPFF